MKTLIITTTLAIAAAFFVQIAGGNDYFGPQLSAPDGPTKSLDRQIRELEVAQVRLDEIISQQKLEAEQFCLADPNCIPTVEADNNETNQ